jgi:hypothetical protein
MGLDPHSDRGWGPEWHEGSVERMPFTTVLAHVDLISEAQKRSRMQRFRESDHWADKPVEWAHFEAGQTEV